jgi:hypothetical protein
MPLVDQGARTEIGTESDASVTAPTITRLAATTPGPGFDKNVLTCIMVKLSEGESSQENCGLSGTPVDCKSYYINISCLPLRVSNALAILLSDVPASWVLERNSPGVAWKESGIRWRWGTC